jgi:predicted metal-dependent TIM-barrel fold hydrolase
MCKLASRCHSPERIGMPQHSSLLKTQVESSGSIVTLARRLPCATTPATWLVSAKRILSIEPSLKRAERSGIATYAAIGARSAS